MKIVHIIPGAGGSFYCENCLRDSVLVRAQKQLGYESYMVPLYLPLQKKEFFTHQPVFFGAVNMYLKQTYPFLQFMPKWLEHFFNSKSILKLAARFSGSTDARGLEGLTLSMLEAKSSFQKQELKHLIDYLQTEIKPDLIHLSNGLLTGLAKGLKEATKAIIICSLQDEHLWIDEMEPKYAQQAWTLINDNSAFIDLFLPVSHYYETFMRTKIPATDGKSRVAYPGFDLSAYPKTMGEQSPKKTLVLGYLARYGKDFGLDILIEAMDILVNQKEQDIRLIAAGGFTAKDKNFIKKCEKKIKKSRLSHRIDLRGEYLIDNPSDFFLKIDVLVCPFQTAEALGIQSLEAMVCGVPSILSNIGAFPEISRLSGGALLFDLGNRFSLTQEIDKLYRNRDLLKKLSQAGWKNAREYFSLKNTAMKIQSIYKEAACC